MRGFMAPDGFSDGDIDQAQSIDDISSVLAALTERFGFDDFAIYDDVPDKDAKIQPVRVLTSLPEAFHSGLDAINANGGDDFLERTWHGAKPAFWNMETVRAKRNPVFARALEAHFRRFGMSAGVNIPLMTGRGRLRVISFTGNREPLAAEETEALHYIVIIVLNRLDELEFGLWAMEEATLNPMERTFLSAFANGEDSAALALKYRLSVSTAAFILDSARRRLGASSLTHAVAVALRKGLID